MSAALATLSFVPGPMGLRLGLRAQNSSLALSGETSRVLMFRFVVDRETFVSLATRNRSSVEYQCGRPWRSKL